MKKLSYIVLFLILGMNLTAQSVWDGKREAIRNGSGTENDPYLIENAQQLAWFVYTVNWDYAPWTNDQHFLLTTDINLNGSPDNQWIPIGAGPSASGSKYFNGVIDGGFHKISGFYIDNDNAIGDKNSMWESSFAAFFVQLGNNATVKNLYLEGSVTNDMKSAGFSGKNGIFEYCVADVDVESDKSTVAGFVAMGNPTIEFSANLGDIKGYQGVGGFIGMNGIVRNCYNTGKIEGDDAVGGIAGRSTEIVNCYNVGEIVCGNGTNKKGGIVGFFPSSGNVTNCYYLESCMDGSNGYGEPKTAGFMRSRDFIDLLNNDTNVWVMDEKFTNDGYPVFGNVEFGINENFFDNTDLVVVFPNPAADYINVLGDALSCEIYDMVGRRVKTVSGNIDNISVTNLNTGVYMIRFTMRNGSVVTKKIVKK
ncbi:MAG: T9SS type A sorting domain-containing protein [Bacteroidales bacterium]|nr:T9SS type A sorting domain-containing protein [Bacteroidales bacterium]